MPKKVSSLSFSELLTKASVMADNIALNSEKIGKYGLDLPDFTDEMKTDVGLLESLNKEQERLKSELKAKTEELNALQKKVKQNYALAKKTVKLAEAQVNWKAYGIDDQR